MKLGWIGTAAFQAFDGSKELVFDLAEGQSVPPDFKEGDEIEVVVHPDHPAYIAMGMNAGYYDLTHIPSGKKMRVDHQTSSWRFDKKFSCEPCSLKIEKSGDSYAYKKPGIVVPTALENFHILRRAYETELCPLCGLQMKQE
jgi:hypothetical protein